MYEVRCRSERIRSVIRRKRESGVVAILTVVVLVVLLGFVALALDLSRLYNRRIEMQNVASSTALAAAASLNGTREGVEEALLKASSRLNEIKPSGLTYEYGTKKMQWSDDAITFSTAANGDWVDAATAAAQPDGLIFAQVNTAQLDPKYGIVKSMLIQVVSPKRSTSSTSGSAIAGRSAIAVTPLALCTMRPDKAENRSGELVEFGFRRGVSYDLMQLNRDPNASTGETFLIDPEASPIANAKIDTEAIKPFVCTGSMLKTRVENARIGVERPFPLGLLFNQLNSRFDMSSSCNQYTAPPDLNVRRFLRTSALVPWMSPLPAGQSPKLSIEGGRRWNVAGPDPSPATTTAADYGPLWSYAKAVKYAPNEPREGYRTFETGDWKNLYKPGVPKALGYPTTTPYADSIDFPPSGKKGVANRRVLNIPLLACPVTGNSATVLGVGRFFMTVPSTATTLHAEFAGLISDQKLGLQVELYK